MREMRKKTKQITDQGAVRRLLARASVCRLGFSAARGVCDYPYVVPVHFACDGDTLYVHCAQAGLKLELLEREPRVCVEVDEMLGIVPAESPCSFSTRYTSVIAFGRARMVTEPGTLRKALGLLMEKYAGGDRAYPPETWTDRQLGGLAVIAVELEQLSGKRSGAA